MEEVVQEACKRLWIAVENRCAETSTSVEATRKTARRRGRRRAFEPDSRRAAVENLWMNGRHAVQTTWENSRMAVEKPVDGGGKPVHKACKTPPAPVKNAPLQCKSCASAAEKAP